MAHRRPTIGISADLIDHNGLTRAAAPTTYAAAIAEAGGIPIVLPPIAELAVEIVSRCDGLVLTGGDDPVMEPFGVETDSRVTRVRPERQRAESAVLEHLNAKAPDFPVLGVCLGMQMMALHAGGKLDQFMPDSTPSHADHWERTHAIRPGPGSWLPSGEVASKHKQAISDPGSLRVLATAHDGVIEAIDDPQRAFFVGVQWHPERSAHPPLGIDLFRRLVRSCP
jgi:putative glutamine amidotransferase